LNVWRRNPHQPISGKTHAFFCRISAINSLKSATTRDPLARKKSIDGNGNTDPLPHSSVLKTRRYPLFPAAIRREAAPKRQELPVLPPGKNCSTAADNV
jgi:hypothetical protein